MRNTVSVRLQDLLARNLNRCCGMFVAQNLKILDSVKGEVGLVCYIRLIL